MCINFQKELDAHGSPGPESLVPTVRTYPVGDGWWVGINSGSRNQGPVCIQLLEILYTSQLALGTSVVVLHSFLPVIINVQFLKKLDARGSTCLFLSTFYSSLQLNS